MKSRYALFILFLLFSLLGYTQKKILFVGNSLTYANDFFDRYRNLCKENKDSVLIREIVYPGFSLKFHLTKYAETTANKDFVYAKQIKNEDESALIKALKSMEWDYIYLQDRSSFEDAIDFALKYVRKAAPKSNILLYENFVYTSKLSEKLDKELKAFSFSEIKKMAKLIDAELIRFGEVAERCKKYMPEEAIYDNSGHPTPFGTKLNVLMIYDAVYKNKNAVYTSLDFTEKEWKVIKKVLKKRM